MDAIGALIGVILLFLPVIVYVVRRKDYEISVILMMNLALLIGTMIAGYVSWFLFGKENMWIGIAGAWIYAMYVAMKKID